MFTTHRVAALYAPRTEKVFSAIHHDRRVPDTVDFFAYKFGVNLKNVIETETAYALSFGIRRLPFR